MLTFYWLLDFIVCCVSSFVLQVYRHRNWHISFCERQMWHCGLYCDFCEPQGYAAGSRNALLSKNSERMLTLDIRLLLLSKCGISLRMLYKMIYAADKMKCMTVCKRLRFITRGLLCIFLLYINYTAQSNVSTANTAWETIVGISIATFPVARLLVIVVKLLPPAIFVLYREPSPCQSECSTSVWK